MNSNRVEGRAQPGTPRAPRLPGRVEIPGRLDAWDREEATEERHIARPHGRQLLGNSDRVCLWTRERVSIQRVWMWIEDILCADGFRHVLKVTKIHQRDGRVRFDLWTTQGEGPNILAELNRDVRYGYYARSHIHFWNRPHRLQERIIPRQDDTQGTPVTTVKMASWNVRSIANKRDEVEMYLQEAGIKILGMQETNRGVESFPIRLNGFQVFESPVEEQREIGCRGLALCIHNSMVAHEIDRSPFCIAVKAQIGAVEWIILTVYVPPRGNDGRARAKQEIQRVMERAMQGDLGANVVILGDWNTSKDRMPRLLEKWHLPVSLLPCSGSPLTWSNRLYHSAIDHITASPMMVPRFSPARVNRTWDMSDHWPIEITLRGVTQTVEEIRNAVQYRGDLTIDNRKLVSVGRDVLASNRWRMLAEDLEEELDPEVALSQLHATIGELSAEHGVSQDPANRSTPTVRISKGAKKNINQRRKAYTRWQEREAPVTGVLWERYVVARKKALKAKRVAKKQSWLKFIAKGAQQLVSNDLRGHWRWVKMVSNRGRSTQSGTGPIFMEDGSGRLVYTPQERLMEWGHHYRMLLGDPTGHSRDRQHWAEIFQGPAEAPIRELELDVSWDEINHVLHRLKAGKAPGFDGVPPEFYKLAMENFSAPGYNAFVPSTYMGKVILQIARIVWNNGSIPSDWNEAWIISILKKGDPREMNNFRGISLLAVIIKIVITTVVTVRVQRVFEEKNWFITEQAGFRALEECAAHSCSLYEILGRRTIAQQRTFVCFVDLSKAYDTVPIEALLRKMELAGVPVKLNSFLRAYYSNATAKVKTTYGLSELLPILRGLRQGCTASPILFDIFINDILTDVRALGVEVIGLKDKREVGLLFADDLVLMCRSLSTLKQALALLSAWALRNEMKFGIAKCGVMGVGVGAHERLLRYADRWRLNGDLLPIVTQYTYLGLVFTNTLDLGVMIADRVRKGRNALNSLLPTLRSADIPLRMKVNTLIKGVLIPILVFGGELWGHSQASTMPVQQVLDEALRACLRLRKTSRITSAVAIGLEFGVPTIFATVAAARARVFRKFPNLRTTIAGLVRNPPICRQATWYTGLRRWLNRECREVVVEEMSPQEAAERVRNVVWLRQSTNAGRSTKFHKDHNLALTADYLKVAIRFPSCSRGIVWVSKFRLGAIWTARRLSAIEYIEPVWRHTCPFCLEEGDGETLQHILNECPRWEAERERMLRELNPPVQLRWYNLLGGSRGEDELELGGFLSGWCGRHIIHDELHPDPNLIGDVPGFVRVAKFLQEIMPLRIRHLHDLMETPGANAARVGRAALAAGRRLVVGNRRGPAAVS